MRRDWALEADRARVQRILWDDQAARGISPIPHDDCEACGGIGAISLDVPVGHKWFGASWTCLCRRNEILLRRLRGLFAQAGSAMPEGAEDVALADFDPAERQVAGAFLAGTLTGPRGRPATGLLLVGPTGTGKTTLAALIARDRLAAGVPVLWVDYTGLIKTIQATYGRADADPSAEDIIHEAQSVPLLVVDDLGRPHRLGPETEDRIEIIWQIVAARNAARLPTIYTTNMSIDDLATQLGPRIASRIEGDCQTHRMDGIDHRTGRSSRAVTRREGSH
jgi:hypothetical protein